MGTFTNASQLAKRQSARFASVTLTMGEAHKELAKGGQSDFLSQTVGTLSEKQLRQIGHPYARSARVLSIDKLKGYKGLEENEVQFDRDGVRMTGKRGTKRKTQVSAKGRVSDLPINRQTGKLRRGVTLLKRVTGGHPTYDLYTGVTYAKYVLALDGTRYMRPRGLLGPNGLLRRRHRARHSALVDPVRRSMRKP